MNKTLASESELLLDHWKKFEPLSQTVKTVIGLIMLVTFILGTGGNTIVLILFAKYRSLRSPSNTLVMNLTVVDLTMCLLCTPVIVLSCFKGSILGHTECLYYSYIAALTGFVSMMSFAALSVDRCIVINREFPMSHPDDKKVVYLVIIIIWLVSAIAAALPLIGFGSYVLEGSRISCTFDYLSRTKKNYGYIVLLQAFIFVLPLTVIIISYLLIFLRIRSHERRYFQRKRGRQFDEIELRRIRRSRKMERIELKAARAGLILIAVFCFSWLPYSIVCNIALFGDNSRISPIVVTIPGIFAKFSTLLNPLFYSFFNQRFRRKFILLFTQIFRKSSNNRSDSQRMYISLFAQIFRKSQ